MESPSTPAELNGQRPVSAALDRADADAGPEPIGVDSEGATAMDAIAPDPPTGGDDAPAASGLRQEALAPYVQEFLLWAEQVDPKDVPHFVMIGDRKLELGSWERSVMKERRAASGADPPRALALLAEGVAIQCKCLDLMKRFEHGPMPTPAELPRFLKALVDDVAVGIALQQELQWDMNELIGAGRLPEAKCLARFQARVVLLLTEVKNRIGPADMEEAERRARSLVTVEPEEADEAAGLRRLAEDEPDRPSWVTYGEKREPLPPWLLDGEAARVEHEPRVPSERHSLAKPLLYVLCVLIAVYGAVMLPRLSRSGPPLLTLEQFSHLEALRSVAAHPPSLYVVLDGDRWRAGSSDEQRRLLEEVGRIALAAGYSGVHARTSDGVTVGQWLRKTGVRLIGRAAGAS
jgi:hypothetical protein